MLQKVETELRLRGSSEFTIRTYMFYNKKFLAYVQKNSIDVTEDDVKSYLAKLISEGSKNTTLSLVKSALYFFYVDILKKKFDIKTPKIDKKVPVVLTKDELRNIFGKIRNTKHRLMLEFLYSTGVRLSECINFRTGDLELNDKIAWVRHGKGAKDRMVLLSEKLVSDLKTHIGSKKVPSEYIFSVNGRRMSGRSLQKMVKRAANDAGIVKKVSPHSLRHSYATHLLDAGIDIRKIQVLLGHSNLNTTERYTHISNIELKKIKNPLDEL